MSLPLYTPIDSSSGETRRLILQPAASHEAEIVCGLEPISLAANPEFEALSYAWGAPGAASSILLNNYRFPVRENAASALRHLRLAKRPRYLWVDAICINQADGEERDAQMPLMRHVYGQAVRVCVWLGEPTDNGGNVGARHLQGHKLVVGWGQYRAQRRADKSMLSFRSNYSSSANLAEGANMVEEQMNGEVRELLDRPWWRRTWVIQEAVLAREIVLMCGHETVAWDSIERLVNKVKWTQGRVEVFGVPVNEKDAWPDDIYRTICHLRQRLRSSDTIGIFDVLYRFRSLDCTKKQDKIYGFLGVIPQPYVSDMHIDSRSTVAQVYRRFAYSIIRSTRSLDVLNCKREWRGVQATLTKPPQAFSIFDQARFYDHDALVSTGPGKKPRHAWSRLPDGWERVPSGNKSFFHNHADGQLYETSPLEGYVSPPEYQTKRRVLPPGWKKRWDSVGRATVLYETEETEFEAEARHEKERLLQQLAKMPSWVPNWATPTGWDPAPLIDWTLPQLQYWACGDTMPYLHSDAESRLLAPDGIVFDEIEYLAEPWHPKSDIPPMSRKGIDVLMAWEALAAAEVPNCPYQSIGRSNALWRTMIADHAGPGAAPDDDGYLVEAWYDRVGWAGDIPDLTGLGNFETTKLQSDLRSMEARLVEHLLILKPPGWNGMRDALKSAAKAGQRVDEYAVCLKRIHRVCAHRALFVTKRGYIGLAPWNARRGDAVAVLSGGRTPYLIRPWGSTSRYELVGESYVYGIMAGEALSGGVQGLPVESRVIELV